MAIARRSLPPGSTTTLRGVPQSVSTARCRVRRFLGAGHPASDEVVLLVSEVVTNSVVHSTSCDGGEVAMTVAAGPGTVVVEVSDAGSGASAPHVRNDPEAENGRGMFLVDLLASRWGIKDDGRGGRRTVWFEIDF